MLYQIVNPEPKYKFVEDFESIPVGSFFVLDKPSSKVSEYSLYLKVSKNFGYSFFSNQIHEGKAFTSGYYLVKPIEPIKFVPILEGEV